MQTMGNVVFFVCAKNQTKNLIITHVANKRTPPYRQSRVCMLITVLMHNTGLFCRDARRWDSGVPTLIDTNITGNRAYAYALTNKIIMHHNKFLGMSGMHLFRAFLTKANKF